jgi:hypothetical protein
MYVCKDCRRFRNYLLDPWVPHDAPEHLQGMALASLRYSTSKLNCAKPTRRHTPSLIPSTYPERPNLVYITAKESAKNFGGPGALQIAGASIGRLQGKTSFPSPLGVAEPVTRLMPFTSRNVPRAMSGAVLGMCKNLSKYPSSHGLKGSSGLLASLFGQQIRQGIPILSLE